MKAKIALLVLLAVWLCAASLRAEGGNNVPRTLAFVPAAGSTITFASGGNAGSAAPAQNIVVTSTGNPGRRPFQDAR